MAGSSRPWPPATIRCSRPCPSHGSRARATVGCVYTLGFYRAQRTDIVEVRYATRCDYRDRELLRKRHRCLDIQAIHHAVTTDVGKHDRRYAIVFEVLREVHRIVPREFRPAFDSDLAVAYIQADDDMPGEFQAHVGNEVRGRHRLGSQNDVADSGVEVALGVVDRPAVDAESQSGGRHQLQQAAGALGRDCRRVEGRLEVREGLGMIL